jgi:hypothetical protein
VDVDVPSAGVPDPSAARIRALLRRRQAPGPHDPPRSFAVGGPQERGPDPDELTDRVEATMRAVLARVPGDEVGDPRDFRRALGVLLGETRSAAQRLRRDPAAPLSPGAIRALEAVVRTDGTRPSLLVRADRVDVEHPLAGAWTEDLRSTQEALSARLRAVGRIEPANATSRSFFGTGWVVDSDAGLVLTNQHVVEEMWQRLSTAMLRTPTGFRVLDGAFIDFAAEAGTTSANRFKVVEARPSGVEGSGFVRLDTALLRIEPTEPDQAMPPAVPVIADPDGPRGALASFCVAGFPGPAPYRSGVHEGVDWAWVNATLFGNRYGVKRLAPGNAHLPVGAVNGDDRHWVFGHDATTLGGSSGSAVIGWLDAVPGAFGLHFAGTSVESNYAHAFSACTEELAALGVPL